MNPKNIILLLFFSAVIIVAQCQTLPETNRAVIDFVNKHSGKKVDRGECWDLAAKALNEANAKWDGGYGFGIIVDPEKDEILPGDVIQFEKVYVEYTKENVVFKEQFPHHTAIVYEVTAKGQYKIAHQNSSKTGRKVGITELTLKDIKKGKITFYRPQKK